jgi:transketolase
MSENRPRVMRDVLIEQIYGRMFDNKRIVFLSADFGSPVLDKLRASFPDRFMNVGIAEQNLINIATGFALEGFVVYAYGIAPFITMRAYEQIRINLSMLSHTREINVNLIGVGAGLSYDFTGPTHHCLEDLGIMRLFPNLVLFSPSDSATVEAFVDYSVAIKKPKYLRLEGKPVVDIDFPQSAIDMSKGFREITFGSDVCLVCTGHMTQKALRVAGELRKSDIDTGVIDVFLLKPVDEELLCHALSKYRAVYCIEEAFAKGGGLGTLVSDLCQERGMNMTIRKFGFEDKYCFEIGDRDFLHEQNGLGYNRIVGRIKNVLSQG